MRLDPLSHILDMNICACLQMCPYIGQGHCQIKVHWLPDYQGKAPEHLQAKPYKNKPTCHK